MSTGELKPSKRTSTPIEGTEFLDLSRECPVYEDWKRYLHMASARNLRVRGLIHPPKCFISGHINFNKVPIHHPTRKPQKITFADVENQHKFIDVVDIDVGKCDDIDYVLNNAITCSTYEKNIEVRNNNIKGKIIPMLQKGLKKLCLKTRKMNWKHLGSKRTDDDFVVLDRDESASLKDTYLLVLH